jgi:(4-O-methyl)-D-glucuronate---lignin esterase
MLTKVRDKSITARKIYLLAALIGVMSCALYSRAQARQADSLRAGFLEPPAAAKARCYWWWLNGNTTQATITHDLEEMKSHEFGGAILVDADGSGQDGNVEVPTGPLIGSPKWIALFVHALAEARRLGLEISLNVTSRWDVGIIGGPTVKPEDAMKLMTWSRTIVDGGGRKRIQLPSPPEQNGFYRPIAVLAYPLRHGAQLPGSPGSARRRILNLAFKTASRETGFSMPPSDEIMSQAPGVSGEQDASVDNVVDLTANLDRDGDVEWNFPPGTWEVLRIGYTDSSKHLIDSSGTPRGLPLDALSPTAFDHYWRDAVMPLLNAAKPYIGTSLRYLVTDSWEAEGANWTDGFREEFKRRRGYDPLAYLPIVAGRILDDRDTSNRFLFDLRRTVADLIAQNYYDRFAEIAKVNGLGTHPEAGGPHGAPIDALENFRGSAFPQTEFWVLSGTHRATEGERFFVKEASSAAHIYGKPIVAAEGPTSMNPAAWSESLSDDLQPTFDHALTEGLNRLFWHEFTSSPAKYGLPGQEYFAGTHLNPQVTWWNQAKPFLLALNRAQFLMQQGKPVSDLLYFYGDQIPGFARFKDNDPAHVLPGYDYDVTDEDALLHRMVFTGSDLRTPNGLHYRALALPASQALSFPALLWISRFVQQGGVVVGLKPTGPLGRTTLAQQEEYHRVSNAMWAGCAGSSTIAHYGRGTIYCTGDSRSALTAIKIAPDFSYQLPATDVGANAERAFDYIHRATAGADIYFIRNNLSRDLNTTLSFRVHGRAPELWSADDHAITPVLVFSSTGDGRTEIPLSFPARGSVFIVFQRTSTRHLVKIEKDGNPVFPSIRQGTGVFAISDSGFVAMAPGTYLTTDTDGAQQTFVVKPAELPTSTTSSWTLSFPAGWGAPRPVPWNQFESWTESSDPGIRYFSGTAVYRATLHIPNDLPAPNRQLWLQLGQVREIATLVVNGHPVETLWRQPFAARIDKEVHPGDNSIEIRVSNLWPNRLIGDLQISDATQFAHTNIHAYTKNSPLLPSGILKPVTLEMANVVRWK